jgi:DNA-binding CsgD family transcriptional regulator
MLVLRQFHELLGELINGLEATVGGYEGDGVMVFFNDPVPCVDPALRAVKMALAIREAMGGPIETWRRRGYQLGLGVGISFGYATLGEIGFEGRYEYGAIGSVVNLASRLCDETVAGQIIISQPAYASVEDWVRAERLPDFTLKGISKPVAAYSVTGLSESGESEGSGLPAGLSRREVEILRLVAGGKSSREISDELVLSDRTVERHITNIYTKIGVHSRAQATAWAIGHGLCGA